MGDGLRRVVWVLAGLLAWSVVGPGGTRVGGRLGPLGALQAWCDRWNPGRREIVLSDYVSCGGGSVANAGVARAISAAAGRPVRVPSGCRVLLGPTSAPAAVTLPSGTRLDCDDRSATFVLARRVCTGGATPGAACNAAADCAGGGCAVDGDAAGPFAPTATETAIVFGSAIGGGDVEVERCTVQAGQTDGYGRCGGGVSPGRACSRTAACDGDGTCDDGQAKPSGPGRITVFDLAGVARVRIDGVRIQDHCDGPFTIRTGHTAFVTGVDTMATATTADPGVPFCAPDQGVAVAGVSRVERSVVRGAQRAIATDGALPSTVTDNVVSVDPPAPGSTLVGVGIWAATLGGRTTGNRVSCRAAQRRGPVAARGTGILLARDQQTVDHNLVSLCFHGIEVAQQHGNVTIDHNRILWGTGAKLVLAQYGNTVTGNYLAWGTGDPNTTPPGRTCRGGVHPRAICATDTECGGGTCQQEPVIWIGLDGEIASADTNHVLIDASNIIHSNWPGVAGIRFADMGRRCKDGAKSGTTCRAAADCPGGRCEPTHHQNLTITGNQFLVNKPGAVGIDMSDLVGGETTVDDVLIEGNHFGQVGGAAVPLAVRMPADPRLATGIGLLRNFGRIEALVEGWSAGNGVLDGNVTNAELGRLPAERGGAATGGAEPPPPDDSLP